MKLQNSDKQVPVDAVSKLKSNMKQVSMSAQVVVSKKIQSCLQPVGVDANRADI